MREIILLGVLLGSMPLSPLKISSGVSAITCPLGLLATGKSSTNDGSNCYYGPYTPETRNRAFDICSAGGAYLYDVQNYFANTGVMQMSANVKSVWLGLTCTTGSKTSCYWDYGTYLTSQSFTNFFNGSPNPSVGACVYMDVTNGFWYNADCFNTTISYGCKFTPSIEVPTCVHSSGNGQVETFQGKCYFSTLANSFADAVTRCKSYCGTVASIHSPGENSFIQGLASSTSPSTYFFTGLSTSNGGSSYFWNDYSPYNYTNWGWEIPQMGSCVVMAKSDDSVSAGQWINNECNMAMQAVCKKDIKNSCDAPTTPPTTQSPLQCTSPYHLSGSGQIVSPGYPYDSLPNSCTYLIAESQGQRAQVSLSTLTLDAYSTISFYNSNTVTSPFKTLAIFKQIQSSFSLTNGNYQFNDWVAVSNTNVIKMLFNTTGNGAIWTGTYGTSVSTTTPMLTTSTTASTTPETTTFSWPTTTRDPNCGNWYGGSGEVTSDNFPSAYATEYSSCYYYLSSGDRQQTCVYFDMLVLRDFDSIYVYDGEDRQLIKLTANNNYNNWGPYCSEQALYVTLLFVKNTPYRSSYINFAWRAKFDNNPYVFMTTMGVPTTSFITTTAAEQPASTSTPTTASVFFCGQYYYGSGQITSANYPNTYPPENNNCTYYLGSYGPKTCITFDDWAIRSSDFVTLYDGVGTSSADAIVTLWYNSYYYGVYCSRNSRKLTVQFSTFSIYRYITSGFKARYADNTYALIGSTTEENPTTWGN